MLRSSASDSRSRVTVALQMKRPGIDGAVTSGWSIPPLLTRPSWSPIAIGVPPRRAGSGQIVKVRPATKIGICTAAVGAGTLAAQTASWLEAPVHAVPSAAKIARSAIVNTPVTGCRASVRR
jgi:hypothetical protein